jgi:hypothetical protein
LPCFQVSFLFSIHGLPHLWALLRNSEKLTEALAALGTPPSKLAQRVYVLTFYLSFLGSPVPMFSCFSLWSLPRLSLYCQCCPHCHNNLLPTNKVYPQILIIIMYFLKFYLFFRFLFYESEDKVDISCCFNFYFWWLAEKNWKHLILELSDYKNTMIILLDKGKLENKSR